MYFIAKHVFLFKLVSYKAYYSNTVEYQYNEILGTSEINLL